MEKPRCGATSETKDADDVVQEICDKVRSQVESKANSQFEEFAPVKYRTQLVNGINYFVKIRVGEAKHLHVRAHKSFQGEVTLWGYQENKSLEDEIDYFQ